MTVRKDIVDTEHDAGLPDKGEPVFLVIGKLRRPHALHGEMLMEIMTDFPERIKPNNVVYVGEEHLPMRIRSCRIYRQMLLIAFDNYHDPESIGQFRNNLVYVRTADIPPLPEGEYYHHQLLGMRVVSEDGRLLGHLIKILETGANDVYLVRTESGPDLLLPAIDSVILEINIERNEMLVHLLPGLEND